MLFLRFHHFLNTKSRLIVSDKQFFIFLAKKMCMGFPFFFFGINTSICFYAQAPYPLLTPCLTLQLCGLVSSQIQDRVSWDLGFCNQNLYQAASWGSLF